MTQLETIKLADLKPFGFKIRESVGNLEELKASMKEIGLIEPLIVRTIPEGTQVVCGHRRFVCAVELGWEEIDAIRRDMDDKTAFELALSENIHRANMSTEEEANAFKLYLIDKKWGSQGELAMKLGVSDVYISERLSHLRLPTMVRDLHRVGTITFTHARGIGIIKDPQKAEIFAQKVKELGLSTEQTYDGAHYVQDGVFEPEQAASFVAQRSIRVPGALQVHEPRGKTPLENAVAGIEIDLQIALDSIDSRFPYLTDIMKAAWQERIRWPLHNLIDASIKLKKEFAKEIATFGR